MSLVIISWVIRIRVTIFNEPDILNFVLKFFSKYILQIYMVEQLPIFYFD